LHKKQHIAINTVRVLKVISRSKVDGRVHHKTYPTVWV